MLKLLSGKGEAIPTRDSRKRANDEIIARMRSSDSLVRVSPQATWFPPRPLIKKDKQEIARLYGGTRDE